PRSVRRTGRRRWRATPPRNRPRPNTNGECAATDGRPPRKRGVRALIHRRARALLRPRKHLPTDCRAKDSLMAMTFDATLKDMGRDSPQGFLAAFDRPPTGPVRLLNVDLSTVTTAADLILGLGDPLEEVLHLDFQSSAAAWKHADLLVYNALLFGHYHVPV